MRSQRTTPSKKIQVPCPSCGALLTRWPSDISKGHRYCNRACRSASLMTPEQRFWSKVDRSGQCWIWTGGCFAGKGYGRMHVRLPVRHSVSTHRFSWELHFGPIPPGLFVCHHCDNPPCVRPDHLFLGTSTDNMRDMIVKGRNAVGERNGHYTKPENTPRGEGVKTSKLTKAQVLEILSLRDTGISAQELASRYGIGAANIYHIWRRISWKHLTHP